MYHIQSMGNLSWDWTFPEVERSYRIWQPFQKRQFARTDKACFLHYLKIIHTKHPGENCLRNSKMVLQFY